MASGVISKVANSFRDLDGAAGAVARGGMSQFKIGLGVMAVGLAGLAALDSTIASATAFGKSIALVATEIDKSKLSQDQMADITTRLAGQFGRMPVDEAAALYKAVALGADNATKATYILTAANQLAVAGNSDLATTMDALGGSLNAYHLKAEDAARVSDAFFTAMKNGNTTVQDLASSVGRVSAGAHEMGISIEEILGSVAVMTNKGIKAAEAVSYLHGALANVTHPSADATKEAKRMGIEFNAAAVRAKGFPAFLHSIADNSKFTKDSLGKLFTSVEGSQAMAMLAGDMHAVDDIMKELKTGSGATAKGFEIMAATAAFQEDRFKALFETMKIRVGEVLEPMKAGSLRVINSLIQGFTELPGPVMTTVVRIASFAAGLVAAVGATAALMGAVKLVVVGLLSFGGPVLIGLLAALLPAVAAVGALTLGVVALRDAFDNNIGGLGKFLRGGEGFAGVLDRIGLAWKGLVSVFSTGRFSGELFDELNKAENSGVLPFVLNVYVAFNKLKSFFAGVAAGWKEGLAAAEPSFQRFATTVESLMARFDSLWSAVDPSANREKLDAAGASGKHWGQTMAAAASRVVDGFSTMIERGQALYDSIVAQKPKWDEFTAAAGGLASSLSPVVGILAELIVKLTGGQLEVGASAFSRLGSAIVSAMKAASAVIDYFMPQIRNFGSVIGGAVDLVVGLLTGNFSRAWEGVKTIVVGYIKAMVDAIMFLPRAVGKALGLLGESAHDKLQKSNYWDITATGANRMPDLSNVGGQSNSQLAANMGNRMGLVADEQYDEMSRRMGLGAMPVGPGDWMREASETLDAEARDQAELLDQQAAKLADATADRMGLPDTSAQQAALEAMAERMNMGGSEQQGPTVINLTAIHQLDGETIAEKMTSYSVDRTNRSGVPAGVED